MAAEDAVRLMALSGTRGVKPKLEDAKINSKAKSVVV